MTDEPKTSRIRKLIESVRETIGADLSSSTKASAETDEIDLLADAVHSLLESVQKQRVDQERTQAAVWDCKDKYRRLKANIPGMVYVFARHPDGSFSFPFVNEGSRQLFDIQPEDLMRDATLLTRLIHPDDRNRFETSVKRSAEMLLPNREIFRHIVHGEVRWYDCMSRPELQPDGDVLWDGIILEVTDRMVAMESLRESEQKLSNIISASPIGIAIYDGSGQCIQANDSIARIIGATKDQVLEQNYNHIASWKESGLLEMAVTSVRTKSPRRHEIGIMSSFGKEVLLDCHLLPFGPGGLLLMAQDITEHKRAERTLRKTVEILTNSQRLAKVGSWDWDVQTGDVEWSDEIYLIFGIEPGNFRPRIETIMSRFHPDNRRLHETILEQAFTKREPFTFESRIVLDDGSTRFLISTLEGHFDDKGNVIRLSGTVQDITERKTAEADLIQRERLLNNIIDQNPHALWISDDKGTMIRINKACCDLLHIKEEQGIGKYNVLKDSIVSEQGLLPEVQSVFREGKTANFILEYDSAKLKHFKLDRTVQVILDVTIAPVKDEAGAITNAIIMHRDITETRKAVAALRKAKAYAENLVDSANAMIVVLDARGQIQVFNQMAEEITGYRRPDLLGRNWFEVLVPKDKYPEVWEVFRKTGGQVIPRTFENPIVTKDGKERFISWQNTEIMEDGAFAGVISYGIDITERKQLEEQLLRSQRMEAIGQLAGGIAHDFNNMLSVILGYAELIKSGLPQGHPMIKSAVEIEKAGLHSRDITRQLLAFSRKQIIAPKTTNLNKLIKNITKTLSQLIGENIDLRFFPGENLWKVRVDHSQVDQILINLAVNARDAMPAGGALTIETSNAYLDETYCVSHVECSPGYYVLLEVTDTGAGMDKEMLSHVFEPFFTTKEVGKGTGLGLATVYGIVKQNGGFINIYSELGKGASFKIYIPRMIDSGEEEERTEEAPPSVRSGRVLLVEDDDMVRKMTAAILEKIGYSVIQSETPMEALTFCEKETASIDLLITDVVMPQMSGTELTDKIRKIKPGLKVLFMSGYTENVIVRQGVLKEGIHFVQKPFSMNDFARKVREAMEDG